MESTYFDGDIGVAFKAVDFPLNNYVIDKELYKYEGQWSFSVVNNNDYIYGARFGFGAGYFDSSDFGTTTWDSHDIERDSSLLYIEIMTKDGAYLWQCYDKYKSDQIITKDGELDFKLTDNGQTIASLQGWPNVRWVMNSDDGEIGIDVELRVKSCVVFPDNVLPSNMNSMWASVCDMNGSFILDGKKFEIQGTSFFDRPRINPVKNDIPKTGSNLYLPIQLEDDSYFVGYYSTYIDGSINELYSFGWYIKDGFSEFMPNMKVTNLVFDEDDKPKTWDFKCSSDNLIVEMKSTTRNTTVKKCWGSKGLPQTRKGNPNLPLDITCSAVIQKKGGSMVKVNGEGLAEYMSS